MEQRDLLKDQLEQLGRVLGQMLSEFLGLKAQGRVEEVIEGAKQTLHTALDLDPDDWVRWTPKDIELWVAQQKWTSAQLDPVAHYCFEVGSHHRDNESLGKPWLETAQTLLKLAEKQSDTLTFQRMELKTRLRSALKDADES